MDTKKLSKQEIFDLVYQHYIWFRKPLSVEEGNCLFRGPNGSKCAVGVIIPDEIYQPYFEGWYFSCIVRKIAHLLEGGVDDTYFLSCLRNVHDKAAYGEYTIQWGLEDFAKRWGLLLP